MGVGDNKAHDHGTGAVVCFFGGTAGEQGYERLPIHIVDTCGYGAVVLYERHDQAGIRCGAEV